MMGWIYFGAMIQILVKNNRMYFVNETDDDVLHDTYVDHISCACSSVDENGLVVDEEFLLNAFYV